MKDEIHLGRVIGETEAFVDAEFDGHDARKMLMLHAEKCFEMFTPDERAKISDIIIAFTRGDIAGTCTTARIDKNCYAIANEKPPQPRK